MNKLQFIRDNYPIHKSMRGWFGWRLFEAMAEDERIWLILPDLGYKLFDLHLEHFPERVKSIGASEQAACGICVGLALEGKIPFLYSITTFLLYRGFEWHRNYLNHEGIPVRLVGSGLDDDYKHDGITHQPWEAERVLRLFPRIQTHFPKDKEEIPGIVQSMIENDEPSFLCLRR